MEDNQEVVSSIDTLSEVPTDIVNGDDSDNQVMVVKDKTNVTVKNSTFDKYFDKNGTLKPDVTDDQLIFEGDFKNVSIIINRPVELISKDATLINSTIELKDGADNVIIDGFKFDTARENAIIIKSNNVTIINNNFIYAPQNKFNTLIHVLEGKNIVVKNNKISVKANRTDSNSTGVIYFEDVSDSKILNNTIIAEIPSVKTAYDPVDYHATYNSFMIQVSGDNNIISKNEISFKYSCVIGGWDTVYGIISLGVNNTISKNNIEGIGNSYVYGIKAMGEDEEYYGYLFPGFGSAEISDNNINLIGNYSANGITVSGPFEANISRNNVNLTANGVVYGTNDEAYNGELLAKYINNTFILSSNSVYGMEIMGQNETVINNDILANGNYTLGIAVSNAAGIASILNNTIKVDGKGLGNATGGDSIPSINAGIYLHKSTSAIVSGNTIVAEIPAVGWGVKAGGIVSDVGDVLIENNNVNVTGPNTKDKFSLYGVKLSGDDLIFRNNTIFVKGGYYGYALDASGENITIDDCTITVNNPNYYGCGINIYSFTGTIDNNIIDITAEGAAYGTASGYYPDVVKANYTNNVVTVNADAAYGLQFCGHGEENAIGNKIIANGNYTMGITVDSNSLITKNTIESNGIGKTHAETVDMFGASNQGILIYKNRVVEVTDNIVKTTGNYSVNVLGDNETFTVTVKNNYLLANKLAGNASVNNITPVHPYIKDKVLIANNTPESKTFIESENIIKYFKNGTRWVAVLTDSEGNPISNATLIFNINNVDYKRTTNANGSASIGINLDSGVYKGTIKFASNNNYYSNATKTVTITVLSVIKSQDIQLMFQNGTKFTVTILDGQGKPLANASVQLNINGVIYNRTTNVNGSCGLTINLAPGKYIITTMYNGARQANNITVNSILTENNNLVKYYKNESQYTVKVLDGQGKALANVKVSFNINGVFYQRTTNANGTAKMNINLGPGKYIITATYNGCSVSNNITVLSTVESKDIEMTTAKRIPFVVKILDGQGKPLSDAKLSFNINGVIYERTSAADGTAKLNINLQAGEYIITTMYNGLSQGNTVTVKP